MPLLTSHREALATILAPHQLTSEGTHLRAQPATTAEAAAVLRFATEHRLPVTLVGSGTKSAWGNPVPPTNLLLSTASLAGVREHVWQDLTATVGAGTPWSHLQAALHQHGQTIALDPLWPDTATVGGIIAANDSGSLRTRYGSLRDLIIGMTLVLADGTVAKTGGKVVKNVAGYDLHKLMTGAFGTLGLIAEVTFRLHPIPRSVATWTIASPDLAAIDHARHILAGSTLPFEALQLRSTPTGFALDLKLTSLPERIEALATQLRTLIAPLDITPGAEALWQLRQSFFDPENVTVKVTSVATAIAPLMQAIHASGGQSIAQQCGILTATLPPDTDAVLRLRADAEAAGGTLTLLSWPSSSPGRPDTFGSFGDALPLMREIQRRFDPDTLLNPGRFLAGLDPAANGVRL